MKVIVLGDERGRPQYIFFDSFEANEAVVYHPVIVIINNGRRPLLIGCRAVGRRGVDHQSAGLSHPPFNDQSSIDQRQ